MEGKSLVVNGEKTKVIRFRKGGREEKDGVEVERG